MICTLQLKGWVTINWNKIGEDFKSLVTKAKHERWMQKIWLFLIKFMSVTTGFVGAFYYGFKHGA